MSRSLFWGNVYKQRVPLEVPGIEGNKERGTHINLPLVHAIEGSQIRWKAYELTEMRLRNMILDSGTPFLISKEIA